MSRHAADVEFMGSVNSADGLGSTMAIVDSSGNSQKSYQYDVYGEVTGGSGSLANEFDFAGQQTDGTGLQYLRARYYDPETGTFLSREPLGLDPSWLGNAHGYGGGNPPGFNDPSGLFPVDSDGSQFREYWNWISAELVFGKTLVPWQWIEQRSIDGRPYGLFRVCELVNEYGAFTCEEGVSAEVIYKMFDDARSQAVADGASDVADEIGDVISLLLGIRGISTSRAECVGQEAGASGAEEFKKWIVGAAGGEFDIFLDDAADDGSRKVFLKKKGRGGAKIDTGYSSREC